jgi:peroxiredoxin
VIFLSAYPYHVFDPNVLGDPVKMLVDVTVFDEEEVTATTYADYPAAEFYFEQEGVFFAVEALFDTGELAYRVIAYSTRMDEYELLQDILDTAAVQPVSLDEALNLNQPLREVVTEDNRLSFDIPRNWLYWNESTTSVGFATSGGAYADVSYSYAPQGNSEIVFIIQRLVLSALRETEVVNNAADLVALATRIREEGGGLKKNTTFTISDFNGPPMLETGWLVPGSDASVLTRTRLLDGRDTVYLIQAQYSPKNPALQITVDAIFQSMNYAPPAELTDPTQVGLEVGWRAPEFSLPLLDGDFATLSDYQGKVIFMNMWASWCNPCHREAPALEAMYQQYNGRFEILAVNVGESQIEARGFQQQYDLSFPILLDEQEEVATLYGLDAYPTTYIIGRDGVIIEKIRGSFTEQTLKDVLAIYVGR